MDRWQRFVRWYDLDQGNFAEDIPLYLSLARRTGPPILELGCGTGRLVLALAQAGYRVTGIEHQPAMLSRAQEKLCAAATPVRKRARLLQGDLAHLELDEPFGLAILAANTLMDLAGPQEQAQALRHTLGHLRPGGLLAVDLFHPHPEALPTESGLLLEKTLTDPATGQQALKFVARQVDHARQILSATFIYDEMDDAGLVTRTVAPFDLHYLHRREVEHLLLAAGFEVEAVYGSYELDPYDEQAERMLVLARRPERGSADNRTTHPMPDPPGETFDPLERLVFPDREAADD